MATFVLVPGAWLGGWCWRDVARLVREAGHDAVAITLTGLAERAHLLTPAVGLDTHMEDVVRTLVGEDLHDVVLVGHSYGGTVTTVAAGRVPERLRGLVYLDATIPTNGRSNNDVLPPTMTSCPLVSPRWFESSLGRAGTGGECPRRRPSIGVWTT